MIQDACPHLALFGSVPSYKHLHIFGCTCYPNMTATAPHKLSPCSTRCVFLGYSVDHKDYHCLDLSTNRLIVSRHVVFDEDNFPLTASSSLTDMDFLCELGLKVSIIGTHLTTAGTSPLAPHHPAPEIPPGFEPPVANLPTPAVSPGFLPRAATMAAPPPITIGPPPRTWPPSPVTYVRWEVGARAAGNTWHPWSCPKPGGGSRSHGDTWRPRSCPAPGGGHWSRGDTWHPQSYPAPARGR
jgi:hypothetical protein